MWAAPLSGMAGGGMSQGRAFVTANLLSAKDHLWEEGILIFPLIKFYYHLEGLPLEYAKAQQKLFLAAGTPLFV